MDFSLTDHTACLVRSPWRLKAKLVTETVAESGVGLPYQKLLPTSNDGPNKQSSGEMSVDQDGP